MMLLLKSTIQNTFHCTHRALLQFQEKTLVLSFEFFFFFAKLYNSFNMHIVESKGYDEAINIDDMHYLLMNIE